MTIKSRLKALEAKHARPMKIHVVIVDNGRFYPSGVDSNGPGLSEAEYRELLPEDEHTRVIKVGYVDMVDDDD